MPGVSFAPLKCLRGRRWIRPSRRSPYACSGVIVTSNVSPASRPFIADSRPGMMLPWPISTLSGSSARDDSSSPCPCSDTV